MRIIRVKLTTITLLNLRHNLDFSFYDKVIAEKLEKLDGEAQQEKKVTAKLKLPIKQLFKKYDSVEY